MSSERPIFWLILLLVALGISRLMYAQDGFWRVCNGPFVGSFSGLATKPNGQVFAATDGLIIRSMDHGMTWVPLYNATCYDSRTTVISNIAISPPGDIFLGRWCDYNPYTHEPAEGRVLKSTNNGTDWFSTSLVIGTPFYSIVINGSGYIYAATQDFFGATIYRSGDSGNTWQRSDSGLVSSRGSFATMVVGNNSDIFIGITLGLNAGIWRSTNNGAFWIRVDTTIAANVLVSTREGHLFAGTNSGTYRSTDLGDTWCHVDTAKRVSGLAISSSNHIFAASLDSGVYRSTNNGDTWSPSGLSSYRVYSVATDSLGHLYAGTRTLGLFRSSDEGHNWLQINPGYGYANVYAMLADTGGFLLAGGVAGLHRSSDSGNSWMNAEIPVAVNALTTDSDGHMFAGTSGGGVFRSADGGFSWTQSNNGLSWDTYIWFLQVNSNGHVFAGGPLGSIFRSTDSGNDWVRVDGGAIHHLTALGIGPDDLLLAGTSSGVYHSIDIGGTWWVPGNDGIPSGTEATAFLFPSDSLILAGTDGSGIYRSHDNGWTWLFSSAGLNHLSVSALASNSAGDIFASCTSGGWIYRSTDQGNTWIQFHARSWPNNSVHALAIDSAGYLFASVGAGIFRSRQSTTTSIKELDSQAPNNYSLQQNYPNPFNSNTVIRFQIPAVGLVNLKVFDVLGREVATLLNEKTGPGSYMISFDARGLATGVYFCRFQANSFTQTTKLLLLR